MRRFPEIKCVPYAMDLYLGCLSPFLNKEMY